MSTICTYPVRKILDVHTHRQQDGGYEKGRGSEENEEVKGGKIYGGTGRLDFGL